MSLLIPSEVCDSTWGDIKESIGVYMDIIDAADNEEVRLQVSEWKQFCANLETKPKTPLEALDIIPRRMTIVRNILQIFCTVPVTSCTAEKGL